MAIVLLGAALSAVIAQASLRPLRHAAHTASGVTFTSLGRRMDYDGPDDEVGRMVSALNAMLGRLEGSFAEQRRFVADASHELRTPLAVVRGHLELLAREQVPEEERAETLALVFDELDRMGRLVNDLLQLARLEAGPARPYQPLELTTLVSEAVARARALGRSEVTQRCDGPVWVDGDPDELTQALLNLLRNAIDHTPDTGTVSVTCADAGASARVEVTDTGPGIRPDDLPRVFDRFYRAQGPRSAETGGSGLGLAITKRLVELHGGRISARNRAGGGAAFTIDLPRRDAPEEPATPVAAPARRRRAS
jgi:two-component system OmpR family sensor kinase